MKVSAIVLAGMQALANSQANAQHGYFKASKPSNALNGHDFSGSDHLLDDDNSTSTAIVGPIQPPRHLDLIDPAPDQRADGFVAMYNGCNCAAGYFNLGGTVVLPNGRLGTFLSSSLSNYLEIDLTTLQATKYIIRFNDELISMLPQAALEAGTFFVPYSVYTSALSEGSTSKLMFRPTDGSSIIAKAFNAAPIITKLTEQSVAGLSTTYSYVYDEGLASSEYTYWGELFDLDRNLTVSNNYRLDIAPDPEKFNGTEVHFSVQFIDLINTNTNRLILSLRTRFNNDYFDNSYYSMGVLNGRIKWANEFQAIDAGSFCYITSESYKERGVLFLHGNLTDSACPYSYPLLGLLSTYLPDITWVNAYGHVLKSISLDVGKDLYDSSICSTQDGGIFLVSFGPGSSGFHTYVSYLEEFSHKWTVFLLDVGGWPAIKECGNALASGADLILQLVGAGVSGYNTIMNMGIAGFSKYGFEPSCSDSFTVLQRDATVTDVTDRVRAIDKSHLFSIEPSDYVASQGDANISITENGDIQFNEQCVSVGSVIDSANQSGNLSGALFPSPGDFPAPSPHVPSPIGPTTTSSAWEQFTTLITEMFEETGDDGTTTSSSNAAFGGFPGPDYTVGRPGPSGDDVVFPSPSNNLTSLSPDGEYVPAPGEAPSPGPLPSANDQLMVIVVCCTILGVVLLAVIGIVCTVRYSRNKAKFATKEASVTLEGGEAVRQLRSTQMHVQSGSSSIQIGTNGTSQHGVAQSLPVVAVPVDVQGDGTQR